MNECEQFVAMLERGALTHTVQHEYQPRRATVKVHSCGTKGIATWVFGSDGQLLSMHVYVEN